VRGIRHFALDPGGHFKNDLVRKTDLESQFRTGELKRYNPRPESQASFQMASQRRIHHILNQTASQSMQSATASLIVGPVNQNHGPINDNLHQRMNRQRQLTSRPLCRHLAYRLTSTFTPAGMRQAFFQFST
jgi:hypothetical protein